MLRIEVGNADRVGAAFLLKLDQSLLDVDILIACQNAHPVTQVFVLSDWGLVQSSRSVNRDCMFGEAKQIWFLLLTAKRSFQCKFNRAAFPIIAIVEFSAPIEFG